MFKSLKNLFLQRLIKVLDNHYQRLDSIPHHVAVELLNHLADDAMTKVMINDVPLLMPARYLRFLSKIPHSHQYDRNHPLRYNVERPHSDWMASQLVAGNTAVDVGASAGVVTAKLSKVVGESGSVFSFEPAKQAFLMLQSMIKANHLDNVTCEQMAACNSNGKTHFVEFGIDPSGENPWLPEASTLATQAAVNAPYSNLTQYEVNTIRLDDYFANFAKSIQLIKIDVEGFEIEVLKGAQTLIGKHRPIFSIDIHKHPTAEGNTEAEVKQILNPFGYHFDRIGHVLTAVAK